jgi:excinuclease UvrABC helicase subunit UvrB
MDQFIVELEEKMRESARRFDFKQAAVYRDRLKELKSRTLVETSL